MADTHTTPLTENGTNPGLPYEDLEADPHTALDLVRVQVEEQARTRPYATLAVALAVGYVLGGGLPSVVVRAATAIGGRLLVARALGAVLGDD